jgi:hypothetical protein
VGFTVAGDTRRHLHLGFHQTRFFCEGAACSSGRSTVATGLDGGVRFNLRSRGSVIPWLGAGAITSRVESAGGPEGAQLVSRLGYGGEVALGLYFFGSALSAVGLSPAVRLVAVNNRLPGGDLLRVRFAVFELGLGLGL